MSEQQHPLEQAALESLVASDLSAKLSQWQKPPSPKPKRAIWLWLAALAISILAGWWWLKPTAAPQPQPIPAPPSQPAPPATRPPVQQPAGAPAPIPDPQHTPQMALAQTFYKQPDFSDPVRGGHSQPPAEGLARAEQLFTARKYTDALAVIEQLPKAYHTDAQYLRGHVYFRQKKYAKAAACFADIKSSVKYGDAASWYQTLSLVPEIETKQDLIIKQLKEIANDNGHPWQSDARRLLEKVSR